MAMQSRFKVEHGDVFPYGCFMVGEVTPVRDFDKSTREVQIQAVDTDTGLLVWAVDVVVAPAPPESGESAKGTSSNRTVRVKVLAAVQPVPPEALPGLPFRPVEFEGLTVTPYPDQSGCRGDGGRCRARQAFSYRASGVRAPFTREPVRAAPGRRES